MPEEGWIDAGEEVPEEETTVLVYLDCDFVTLGIWFEQGWETTVAPWDITADDDHQVLFWRYLPWPPAEMLGAPLNSSTATLGDAHLHR